MCLLFFWTFDPEPEETAAQQTNASHMVDASWAWRTRMCTSSLSSSCIVSSRSSKISATASKHALLDLEDLGSLAGWSFSWNSFNSFNQQFQKKMIKFNVLCLGIWINNCNATSVRPSKGSRNLSSAKPMDLQGNLRPHGNHAANRVFRNTIRSISLRSQVVCVSCWNKSEWETMGNNEKNSLKR